ncbi:MAG: hypothetical protein V4592_09095 [Bacteroidota bacterium]
MKTLFFIALLWACALPASSQIKIMQGQYTSGDGKYTVNIFQTENGLSVEEPNKKTSYTLVSGDTYKYTSQYGEYRITLTDNKSAKMYKTTAPDRFTKFSFSGAMSDAPTEKEFINYKEVAKKYQDSMRINPKDAQMYSFCAAAAMARATFNSDGYEEYAKKLILSLKQIMINKTKCPCEVAIPQRLWEAVY